MQGVNTELKHYKEELYEAFIDLTAEIKKLYLISVSKFSVGECIFAKCLPQKFKRNFRICHSAPTFDVFVENIALQQCKL